MRNELRLGPAPGGINRPLQLRQQNEGKMHHHGSETAPIVVLVIVAMAGIGLIGYVEMRLKPRSAAVNGTPTAGHRRRLGIVAIGVALLASGLAVFLVHRNGAGPAALVLGVVGCLYALILASHEA
jgi:hypothetical protein